MNKLNLVAVGLVILIVAEGAGLIYTTNKMMALTSKVSDYEKISKEGDALNLKYMKVSRELDDATRERDAFRADRDNLIAQAKNLMAEKSRAQDLQDSSDKLDKEKKIVEEERDRLLKSNSEMAIEIKKSRESIAQLTKEKAAWKAKPDVVSMDRELANINHQIKEAKKDIESLKEEKDKAVVLYKKADAEKKRIKDESRKLIQEKEHLANELDEFKKNYQIAAEKNNKMENEIRNMPKEFSEIARQNKLLIKETSKMHYNLGVFFTKNKQYDRALSEFEKAVDINPDDASAHFNLGYIYAEYIVDRTKAIEHFRHYLRIAKGDDKDADWARKYILTWQTWEGKQPIQ